MTGRRIQTLASLASALLVRTACAAVGDSVPGLLVTPPSWTTGVVVQVKYTPLGSSTNGPVRLDATAALGMCATLDAYAERFYVPATATYDPDTGTYWEGVGIPCTDGPMSGWATNDYSRIRYWEYQHPIWPRPGDRNFTNEWRRIFPKASRMLEDVRGNLRGLVRRGWSELGVNNSRLLYHGPSMSSSLFGGADCISFGWTSRTNAEEELVRAANELDLCLDWSCTDDYEPRTNNVALSLPSILSEVEPMGTNRYERYMPGNPSPVGPVSNILSTASGPAYSRAGGWLDRTNVTMRISADDFGWMNTLLAIMDKSYYVGWLIDGMPLVRFNCVERSLSADRSYSITNGTLHLSLVGSTPVAVARGVSAYQVSEGSTCETNSTFVTHELRWECYDGAAASATATVGGYIPVALNKARLDDLFSDMGPGENAVRIWAVMDEHSERGPCLIVYYGDRSMPDWIYGIDIGQSMSVSSGSISADAFADVTVTEADAARPYAAAGDHWYATGMSRRHVRPVEPNGGRMTSYSLQTLGQRRWAKGEEVHFYEGEIEYKAMASEGRTGASLDDSARQCAEVLCQDCSDYAAASSEGLLGTPGDTLQALGGLLNPCADRVTDALTNLTWGFAVDYSGMLLMKTNSTYRVVDESTLAELPKDDRTGEYIFARLVAGGSETVGTNLTECSLSLTIDHSAAIYWKWKNLPLEDESQ